VLTQPRHLPHPEACSLGGDRRDQTAQGANGRFDLAAGPSRAMGMCGEGFRGSERASVEQRYERAEKELFARMEGLGRDIENRITGNDSSRLKDQSLEAESMSAAGYGSAKHNEKLASTIWAMTVLSARVVASPTSRPSAM
jgi:hypothetical protein